MLSRLKRRLWALVRKGEMERELDEELRYHLEREIEQNHRGGMSPEEARSAALKAFGGVEQAKERCRDARGVRWLENVWLDLRYGVRTLRKNPGFSLVAVLTLALGIGANTAIFSVVNAVLLRPLPYPESERLVWLSERASDPAPISISYPNFTDWRAQASVFEHLGVSTTWWGSYNLVGGGEPRRLSCSHISADAFAALGVSPLLGRVFNNDEDKAGASPVVVLNHGLWQNRFGGDAGIAGQAILLDGRAYIVIGVMPPDFVFPSRVDLWLPVGPLTSAPNWQNRSNHMGIFGVARLKPVVTLDQARAEMDVIAVRLAQQYPDSNKNIRARIEPLLDYYVSNARPALWTLLGAVGLVLLIACANVANLLLARAATRQREMAVRAALGASRRRILRQLLTESILLAAVGGALGWLLAHWGVPLILAISRDAIPRASEIGLDTSVLGFTIGVAVLTGLLFGLAPAWAVSRADVQVVLKGAGRGTTGGRSLLRQGLMVAEVALTLVLLVGAGLLLRSFHSLQQVDAGFTPARVLSFRLELPWRKYATEEQQLAFYQSLEEKLRALPGVQEVGFGSQFPLGGGGWQPKFMIEGQPALPPHERPSMEVMVASPDYFRALGIRLLRGRYFTDEDLRLFNEKRRREASQNVIIVDEEFARRYWPNEDPIGKRVRSDPAWGPAVTVVGVVARVKLKGLSEQSGSVQAYLPGNGGAVVIKATVEPEKLAAAVRQQVHALDPEQPIYDVRTMTERLADSLAPERLNLTLLGLFAAVALLLASVGLYGVISYAVTQRTRELGLRMAFGAQSRDVLTLVLGQGMMLAIVGVALGLMGALALTRVMESMLFGVSATDPLTFVVIALLLICVSLLACLIPARRATKVDPLVALRYE
jgi:predicted permease